MMRSLIKTVSLYCSLPAACESQVSFGRTPGTDSGGGLVKNFVYVDRNDSQSQLDK